MGSTNHTSNYELSQFLGSDKPAWLLDYNGDMLKIDTQMKANADAASAAQSKADTADGKADDLRTDLTTLNNQVNDPTGLAADVATLAGNVNTINSLIGNGEPTTTDKTLIGAINELDADKGDMSILTTAAKNTIVAAINEINAGNILGTISVTTDGVMTFGDILNTFQASIDFTKLRTESYIESTTPGAIGSLVQIYRLYDKNTATGEAKFSATLLMDNNDVIERFWICEANSGSKQVDIVTTPGVSPTIVTDDSTSFVPGAGRTYKVVY